MQRFVVTLAVAAVLALVPATAEEFNPEIVGEAEAENLSLSCGEIKNSNRSYQFGSGAWIEYIVETTRAINGLCPWIWLSAHAYVVDVPNSGAAATDLFTASVRRQIPVPRGGRWQTNGYHFRHWLYLFTFSNGNTASHADVVIAAADPEMTRPCSEDGPCEAPSGSGGDSASPIVVDVGRDGYRLTSVDDGVSFDLDADGVDEQVAWTHPDSDDAFLALDRNNNGRVDDGSELFGNHTPALAVEPRFTTANGFEALKFIETISYGGGDPNERIESRDRAFHRLLLWTDRNHNGVSEPDELMTARAAGIVDISTHYRESRKRDYHGNEFRQRAKATWADGSEFFVYDVWLKRRR